MAPRPASQINDWQPVAKDPGDWQAAEGSKPAPGYLSQVGTGLWNTVKGLAQVGSEIGGVGTDPLHAVEHLKNLKKLVLDPQVDQAIDAYHKWQNGDRSEAVGHALAAVIPGVGPAAANIGEKLGNRDFTGAAADATVLAGTMAAPHVAGAVADIAPKVGAAVKGGVRGGFEAATETIPLTRYGVDINVPKPLATGAAAGAAARMAGLPATPAAILGGAAPIVKGIIKGARGAAEAAPAVEAAESAAEILAGGKAEFEKLSKGDQAILQHVADAQERMKASGQPAPTPRPAAPASPAPTSVSSEPSKSIADVLREELAAQRGSAPASGAPPVTAAVPESPALRGPVRPPLATQPSPTPIPPQPAPQPVSAPATTPVTGNVGDLARQLFDAMQESGSIPKEAMSGEPIAAQPAVNVDKAVYEGGARSVRADRAGSLAQAAHSGATEAGIDPEALANLSTDQWQQIARRSDIDFPKTKEAQAKLIRDTLVQVMKLSDKPQTIGGLMNPK